MFHPCGVMMNSILICRDNVVEKFVTTNGIMLQEWGQMAFFALCGRPVDLMAPLMLAICGTRNSEWFQHPFQVTDFPFLVCTPFCHTQCWPITLLLWTSTSWRNSAVGVLCIQKLNCFLALAWRTVPVELPFLTVSCQHICSVKWWPFAVLPAEYNQTFQQSDQPK